MSRNFLYTQRASADSGKSLCCGSFSGGREKVKQRLVKNIKKFKIHFHGNLQNSAYWARFLSLMKRDARTQNSLRAAMQRLYRLPSVTSGRSQAEPLTLLSYDNEKRRRRISSYKKNETQIEFSHIL